MKEYVYDEFGHLLTWTPAPAQWKNPPAEGWWSHVHEEQALTCSWYEYHGWPVTA